jgi:hypothetical protein
MKTGLSPEITSSLNFDLFEVSVVTIFGVNVKVAGKYLSRAFFRQQIFHVQFECTFKLIHLQRILLCQLSVLIQADKISGT